MKILTKNACYRQPHQPETMQEHFEKINTKDICSEEEKQEITAFLDIIEEEISSIQEKIGFIRQM